MSTYRIYTLDRNNKISGPAIALEAENDEDALQQAEALIRPMAAEVWLNARLVGSLPASRADSVSDVASFSQTGVQSSPVATTLN